MTGRFQRNELSRIRSVVNREQREYIIGTVKKVFERKTNDDEIYEDSQFAARVYLDDNEFVEPITAPIVNDSYRTIEIPTAGDRVKIEEDSYGRSVITEKLWTTEENPPVGRAGMWKKEVKGPTGSALGDNNLFLTGYTNYDTTEVTDQDGNTENFDQHELPSSRGYGEFGEEYPEKKKAESSVVQIASHNRDKNGDPIKSDETDLKVEVKDSSNGDSHISIEIDKDGSNDSTVTWGMKFNIDEGTFKLSDPEGYGIHAKGDGKFDWYHSDINFKESKNENIMDLE